MMTKIWVGGALLLALSGCGKKEEIKASEQAPTAAAPAPKPADKPAEEKPAAAAVLTAAPGAGAEAPAVPSGTSAPPTVAEWTSAAEVNTVAANSKPKDCTMKMVREWLKVNCTGKIKAVTNMEGFGKKNFDYFELVTPDKVADFVVRVKKGNAIKARILRNGESGASLFVNWPGQLDKPSIVALQIYNG